MEELLLGWQKGGHSRLLVVTTLIKLYFPILFYNQFRTLVTGRLIEGGSLNRWPFKGGLTVC